MDTQVTRLIISFVRHLEAPLNTSKKAKKSLHTRCKHNQQTSLDIKNKHFFIIIYYFLSFYLFGKFIMLYFELSKTKRMKVLFNIIVNGHKYQGYFISPIEALNWVMFELFESNVKAITGAKILIKKVN